MADSTIVRWIKRLFSVSTITVLVSIASLVVAYLAYKSNTPGELSLKLNYKNVDVLKEEGSWLTSIHYDQDSMAFPGNHMLYVENNSSRTIKDFEYSVMVIPHGKCVIYEDEDFEEHDSWTYVYKKDKLTPHTTISGPIKFVKPLENELHLEVIYNITYNGLKEPIIIPSSFVNINDKGQRETWRQYIGIRNYLIKTYVPYDNDYDPQKLVLSVGDTTLVGINNLSYCDTDNYSLWSLDQLKPDEKHLIWWKIIIFIVSSFFCLFFLLSNPLDLKNYDIEYEDPKLKGKFKTSWKELNASEYLGIFLVIIVYVIIPLIVTLFGIYKWIYDNGFFYS